jgi:hypothetical protein
VLLATLALIAVETAELTAEVTAAVVLALLVALVLTAEVTAKLIADDALTLFAIAVVTAELTAEVMAVSELTLLVTAELIELETDVSIAFFTFTDNCWVYLINRNSYPSIKNIQYTVKVFTTCFFCITNDAIMQLIHILKPTFD